MLLPRMLAAAQILGAALAGPPALPPTDDPAYLQWRTPAACPTAADVHRSVERLAGRGPRPGEIEALAVVQRTGDTWTLNLSTRIDRATQHQILEAESCEGLAAATALILSVLLDPVVTAARIPDAPESTPPAPPPTPVPSDAPKPTPTPRPWSFGGEVLAGIETGSVPRGTGGARLTLFASRRFFEARVSGTYWAPRRTDSQGARAQLGTVAANACVVPAADTLHFPLCVGMEAGGLRARGIHVANERTATLPWLAAVVSPSLRWWVRPRIGLVVSGEVSAPLVRLRITLRSADPEEDDRIIHEPAPVGLRGYLGVTFRFSGTP